MRDSQHGSLHSPNVCDAAEILIFTGFNMQSNSHNSVESMAKCHGLIGEMPHQPRHAPFPKAMLKGMWSFLRHALRLVAMVSLRRHF